MSARTIDDIDRDIRAARRAREMATAVAWWDGSQKLYVLEAERQELLNRKPAPAPTPLVVE